MNTLLHAHKLNKTYIMDTTNRNHVLHDVTVSVRRGEFTAVMGPSGSGKSTLLYNICGLDRVTSGSVAFKGNALESLSERELAAVRLNDMGFIFQQIHLLKNLSIHDNIVLPGLLSEKHSRRRVAQRARELMERAGIAELGGRGITQASGGQLQRVGICRALINEPEIVFGEEPTGALNSKTSDEIMDLLNEVNRQGTTVLLVTHDVRVAARAHRVLLMVDGRLVSEQMIGPAPEEPELLKGREERLAEWLVAMGV